MTADVVAVVPSLGRSPVAAAALGALRAELANAGGELIWVSPRSAPPPDALREREQWIGLEDAAGFAAAVNRGIAVTGGGGGGGGSGGRYVAVVNDDAIVEPGWLGALVAALDADERLAAAQGVVVELADPERCDGAGIAWNRWWQAVQVGRGASAPPRSAPSFEPLGVQATAALFRRAALERVATASARPFEERLESWYEDVDLALRLRAAGFGARSLCAARARHAGGATGATMAWRRRRLLARNRLLVVLRLAGRRFPLVLPRLALRDLLDVARALAAGELRNASAIAAGWCGASVSWAGFARAGPPLLTPAELARFSAELPRVPISSTE